MESLLLDLKPFYRHDLQRNDVETYLRQGQHQLVARPCSVPDAVALSWIDNTNTCLHAVLKPARNGSIAWGNTGEILANIDEVFKKIAINPKRDSSRKAARKSRSDFDGLNASLHRESRGAGVAPTPDPHPRRNLSRKSSQNRISRGSDGSQKLSTPGPVVVKNDEVIWTPLNNPIATNSRESAFPLKLLPLVLFYYKPGDSTPKKLELQVPTVNGPLVRDLVSNVLASFEIQGHPSEFSIYSPAYSCWLEPTIPVASYKILYEHGEILLEKKTSGVSPSLLAASGHFPNNLFVLKIYLVRDARVAMDALEYTMLRFESSIMCSDVILIVLNRLNCPPHANYRLYAPSPFNVWLTPSLPLSSYSFLFQHQTLFLRKQDTDVLLRIICSSQGFSSVMKVSADASIMSILNRLCKKHGLEASQGWGLYAKQSDKVTDVFMPQDSVVSNYPRVNLAAIELRRIDIGAQKIEEARKRIALESKVGSRRTLMSCMGTEPHKLPNVEDLGLQVPECLATIRRALHVKKWLNDKTALRSAKNDRNKSLEILRMVDRKETEALTGYSCSALVGAILIWFAQLPLRVYQPLVDRLENAATTYEASMLLAAQLPPPHARLLAWLVTLMSRRSLAMLDTNEEISESIVPSLIDVPPSSVIVNKLYRIVATLIADKIDETGDLSAQSLSQMTMSEGQSSAGSHGGLSQDIVITTFSTLGGNSQYGSTSAIRGAQYGMIPAASTGNSNLSISPQMVYSSIGSATNYVAAPVNGPREWGHEEVMTWINLVDFIGDNVKAQFAQDTSIDGLVLKSLGPEDLAAMGLEKIGPQKKLLKMIQELE